MLLSKLEKPLGSTEEPKKQSPCLLVNAIPKDWFNLPWLFAFQARQQIQNRKDTF